MKTALQSTKETALAPGTAPANWSAEPNPREGSFA
jgi:hypothetical protein